MFARFSLLAPFQCPWVTLLVSFEHFVLWSSCSFLYASLPVFLSPPFPANPQLSFLSSPRLIPAGRLQGEAPTGDFAPRVRLIWASAPEPGGLVLEVSPVPIWATVRTTFGSVIRTNHSMPGSSQNQPQPGRIKSWSPGRYPSGDSATTGEAGELTGTTDPSPLTDSSHWGNKAI